MKKKVLAILLCALMLTAVSPLNVFAEGDTVIENASITFRTDIAGLTADDYKDIIKINSDGLLVDDFNGFDAIFAYELLDNGEESGNRYKGKFIAGEKYVFYVYFAPADGYVLPEDSEDITLNFTADGVEDYWTIVGWDYIDDNEENDIYYFYEIGFEATVTEQSFFAKLMTNLNNFFDTIVEFFRNLFSFIY